MEKTLFKVLQVRSVPEKPDCAMMVGMVLDRAEVAWQRMEVANWTDRYPYKPLVDFRIGHTGDCVLLQYRVTEEALRAVAVADGDAVWEDSCCEFFIQDPLSYIYNNVECNCGGKLLMAVGKDRNNRQLLSKEEMSQIDRWVTYSHDPFSVSSEVKSWMLSLMIPVRLLFDHRVEHIGGMTCRANFYKCGDKLPQPHFLSWNPVDTPQPDFHRPEYFGQLSFLR